MIEAKHDLKPNQLIKNERKTTIHNTLTHKVVRAECCHVHTVKHARRICEISYHLCTRKSKSGGGTAAAASQKRAERRLRAKQNRQQNGNTPSRAENLDHVISLSWPTPTAAEADDGGCVKTSLPQEGYLIRPSILSKYKTRKTNVILPPCTHTYTWKPKNDTRVRKNQVPKEDACTSLGGGRGTSGVVLFSAYCTRLADCTRPSGARTKHV